MKKKVIFSLRKNWQLYLLLIPVLAFYFIFHYIPMYGVQIAFKSYSPVRGIWGSRWIGLTHFLAFFRTFNFWQIIWNTIGISLYQILVGFQVPIILALMINEVGNRYFKKTVQMITYIPYFLSVVVVVGMINTFLSPVNGIVNTFIGFFGFKPFYFMSEPGYFKTIYVLSNVWQNAGWGTIIYIATIAGIPQELYEAAVVDGASKFKRMMHITLPFLIPIIMNQLILRIGQLMQVGFEKVLLMQNPLNLNSSEVVSTYIYKRGLLGAEFSFSSAVGLFNSVINFILLVCVNRFSRTLTGNSLW